MRNIVILLLLCTFNVALSQTPGFTENRGQIVDSDGKPCQDIRFMATSAQADYYFMNDKVILVEGVNQDSKQTSLLKTAAFAKKEILFKNFPSLKNSSLKNLSATKVRFEEPYTFKNNYYLPHCPDGITGVRSFQRVVYENIAENTDLVFEITKTGNIESFLKDKARNRTTPLSILSPQSDTPNYIDDPKVLYASYLGGSDGEGGGSGAADSKSNFWVAGATSSNDFPTTDSALERTKTAGTVIYISKFSSTGELLYSTYYGGKAGGGATAVAVDSEDNPVITGYTSSTFFPVSDSAFQKINRGNQEVLLIKLDATGRRQWATLFGGQGSDFGNHLTIDKQDNIILVGASGWTPSQETSLPVTPDAFQTKYGGGVLDAFIAKFDKNGSRIWATYFGGSDNYKTQRPFGGDKANWVTTDSDDNIILTGTARTAVNFPTTEGAFQRDSSFMDDAFLAKFSPDGQRLWATLYGGTGPWTTAHPATEDEGKSVAVDKDNNIIMVGVTHAVDFPTTPGAMVEKPNIPGGGFIVKFDSNGSRLWATYYTSNNYVVKADKFGNTFIAGGGRTGNNGFVATQDSIRGMPGSKSGGMVLSILREQEVKFATVYPLFTGGQEPHNLAIARNGNIALFGFTGDSDFPVTKNALRPISGTGLGSDSESFIIILHNITTGVDEKSRFKNTTFSIQPNPANDKITLALPEEFGETSVTITNILGEEVLKTDFKNEQNSIDVSLLPAGMYIVRADAKGSIITTGFIKY